MNGLRLSRPTFWTTTLQADDDEIANTGSGGNGMVSVDGLEMAPLFQSQGSQNGRLVARSAYSETRCQAGLPRGSLPTETETEYV